MEMRAKEDIGIGEDITSHLSPLTYSLHNSFLHSHCSSCFSPNPNPNPNPNSNFFYCSSLCSSSLRPSSAELHLLSSSSCTADLRAALRLLHSQPSHLLDLTRISGLLTNFHKFMASDNEMFTRIRDGAKAMASARRLTGDGKALITTDENENDDVFALEAAALCLVLTNAVEVHDMEGRNLGIAVYDINFSWINHSCSPNSCYRFLISPPSIPPPLDARLRIVPACSHEDSNFAITKGNGNYGPRMIVRSIKRIKKNEEVTVAYTDLLQPKELRRSELWSKYRFICSCTRCNASPLSYIDRLLQEISSSNLATWSPTYDHCFFSDEATKKLLDYVDEVITEYLSFSDPVSCCEKLESILILGHIDTPLEPKEGKSRLNFRLHPLHHHALNAYMTLASAYRIRASDLLALNSETDGQLGVFNMSLARAAYSFLLAAATYHLFCFESSLIASVANFWTSAGESLLMLARSPVWDKHSCLKCSFTDSFEANLSFGQGANEDFENISSKFIGCITSFSQKVWSFLTGGCRYLKLFKDPMDFSLHWSLSNVSNVEVNSVENNMDLCRWTNERFHGFEAKISDQYRTSIFQLGVHCLLYGELLARVCYGKCSHRTRHIEALLYCEEK